jgi:hypothetical protein
LFQIVEKINIKIDEIINETSNNIYNFFISSKEKTLSWDNINTSENSTDIETSEKKLLFT